MFITLEGPEGSGKTSVMKEVIARLRQEGFVIEETREPGGTPIAEQIREVILNKENTKLDPRAEALLLAASRRQNLVEKIWPALKAGKIVICDRFIDSSLAYQGGARGLGIEPVLSINLFATESSYPQLTLLFDIPPELGLKRIAANANREINRLDLEQLSFHQKVRDTYLNLAKRFKDRYVVIDASLPLATVIDNTYQAIHQRLL
jgi:dTMP kinase